MAVASPPGDGAAANCAAVGAAVVPSVDLLRDVCARTIVRRRLRGGAQMQLLTSLSAGEVVEGKHLGEVR